MNIGILTSGGDAPGMNSFISDFVKLALKKKDKVFAVKFGFQGLIDNEIFELTKKDVDHISHLGGSFIKSFRSPEFATEKGFEKALKNYKKSNLDVLVILGGDGSIKGAKSLAEKGIKVLFVPATIDNDMFYTDRALGFDSAVNSAVDQIDKIKQTMLSLNRIFICEVMGRRCSDIAKFCAIATDADVLIAEKEDCDFERICSQIKSALKNGEDSPLIILKENITNPYDLAKDIQNKFDIETRASVLGYVQRGTSPSVFDRIYSKQLAGFSFHLIKKGQYNVALGNLNNKLISFDLDSAMTKNTRPSESLTKFPF